MTGRDDPPSPPEGPAGHPEDPEERDPLSAVVQQFAFLTEQDPDLDLERFLDDQPPELRDEIRRRCLDTRRVLGILRRRRAEPLVTSECPERIGEFRIEAELGRGGMGIVYRAWQESRRRRVALKVLGINPGVTVRAIERFRREAVTAGKLRHPGIVEVHEVGEDNGALWIAMECVEGETLSSLLARGNRGAQVDEGRDIKATVERIAQMAEALEYAHSQGIIHRDLKPANVLIDQDGRAQLVDFGLAKDLGELSISRTGDLAGTPHYMSPEQAAAKRVVVDHRSDVFSLGVILYECLTHQRPFEGDSVQRILFEISFREARPLRSRRPSCPRDLATICHKALEKDPAHRFQSAGELAAELRRFLNHESILSRPPGLVARAWRFAARHRVASGLAAFLLVVGAILPIVAGRVAHAARRDATLQPLRELAQYEDLEDAPTQLLLAAYDAGTSLITDGEALPAKDGRLARAQLERVTAHRTVLAERGLARMRSAYDPTYRSDSESRIVPFMDGLRSLVVSTFLGPDRSPVSALQVLHETRPTLTVTCDVDGADVSLVALDRFDGTPGARTGLGRTPLEGAFFDPGYYSIVVSAPDLGFAEMTRLLDEPAREHTVHARLRSTDGLGEEGMVLIADGPGDTFLFGIDPAGPYRARQSSVAPFWISDKEVSNAEYRAFLADTGRPAPGFWPDPWDAALDGHPVSGVNFFEARAYAEWAGMRLPTMLEWQRAARGRDGATTPRPLEEVALDAYALGAPEPDDTNVTSLEDLHALYLGIYLEHSRPVDSSPELRGPEGLYHAFGNVAEWTDTLMTHRDWQGVQFTMDHARAIFGRGFSDPAGPVGMVRVIEMDSSARDPAVGFRCAKSAQVQ